MQETHASKAAIIKADSSLRCQEVEYQTMPKKKTISLTIDRIEIKRQFVALENIYISLSSYLILRRLSTRRKNSCECKTHQYF